MTIHDFKKKILVVSLIAAASLGCGAETPSSVPTVATGQEKAGGDLDEDKVTVTTPAAVRRAFQMISYDYEPRTAEQNAADADLVVVGTLVAIQPGRERLLGDNLPPIQYTALRVNVSEAVQGTGADVGEDIWIEIPALVDPIRRELELGVQLSAYLYDATTLDPTDYQFVGMGQIPAGQTVWGFVNPDGFTIQYGADSGTIDPLGDSEAEPEASLEESLPE